MVCLGIPYYFKLFKGCLPQILLGPFLNTLTQMNIDFSFRLGMTTNVLTYLRVMPPSYRYQSIVALYKARDWFQ